MNSKNTFEDLPQRSSDKQILEWPDFCVCHLHELQCHILDFSQDQAIWTMLFLFMTCTAQLEAATGT